MDAVKLTFVFTLIFSLCSDVSGQRVIEYSGDIFNPEFLVQNEIQTIVSLVDRDTVMLKIFDEEGRLRVDQNKQKKVEVGYHPNGVVSSQKNIDYLEGKSFYTEYSDNGKIRLTEKTGPNQYERRLMDENGLLLEWDQLSSNRCVYHRTSENKIDTYYSVFSDDKTRIEEVWDDGDIHKQQLEISLDGDTISYLEKLNGNTMYYINNETGDISWTSFKGTKQIQYNGNFIKDTHSYNLYSDSFRLTSIVKENGETFFYEEVNASNYRTTYTEECNEDGNLKSYLLNEYSIQEGGYQVPVLIKRFNAAEVNAYQFTVYDDLGRIDHTMNKNIDDELLQKVDHHYKKRGKNQGVLKRQVIYNKGQRTKRSRTIPRTGLKIFRSKRYEIHDPIRGHYRGCIQYDHMPKMLELARPVIIFEGIVSGDEANPQVELNHDLIEVTSESMADFQDFIQSLVDFDYPEIAREAGIEGRIYVSIPFGKVISIEDVEILKSPHLSIEKAFMRNFQQLGDFRLDYEISKNAITMETFDNEIIRVKVSESGPSYVLGLTYRLD